MQISNGILIYLIDLFTINNFKMWFIFYLSLPLFIAFVPAVTAELKGRKFEIWYVYGLVLSGVFVIIFYLIRPFDIAIMKIFPIGYNGMETLNTIMIVLIIFLLQVHALLVKSLREDTSKLRRNLIIVCVFIFCLVLGAGPWIVSFCNARTYPPKPPVIVPIDLTKADNKLEMAFRVADDWTYVFELEFHYNATKQDDRNIVKKIAGYSCGYWNNTRKPVTGKLLDIYGYERAKREIGDPLVDETYTCEGTIIPINLTPYKMQENTRVLILKELYMTQGWNSHNEDTLFRKFASKSMEKGRYIAIFENPQGFPELRGRDIRISISKLVVK